MLLKKVKGATAQAREGPLYYVILAASIKKLFVHPVLLDKAYALQTL